ncbi:DNA cytosine methyltransferase [Chitinasiproducens palmae]|uniref:DNA cytosine methyltransferase n=1 Tax=Chitinasiproducens palmae TaxID=1770053 RepID=UPI000B856E90
MNELALFAGAGGGILGGHLLGWRTVCAVERDAYAAQVLAARQNDGCLRPFPIWSDVTSFDGRPWRGIVDVVSGGFPCQDISSAGDRAGIAGSRSGLWKQFARVVFEVEPRSVAVENSADLTSRGLGVVLGDLAALGFDAQWDVFSAADLGAHHLRERIWIFATHPNRQWKPQQAVSGEEVRSRFGHSNPIVADVDNDRIERRQQFQARYRQARRTTYPHWPIEPGLVRMVHGVPNGVDRVKALGNGQVPRVAAAAFSLLAERR